MRLPGHDVTPERLERCGVNTDVNEHCTAIRHDGELVAILPSDPSDIDLLYVVQVLRARGIGEQR